MGNYYEQNGEGEYCFRGVCPCVNLVNN